MGIDQVVNALRAQNLAAPVGAREQRARAAFDSPRGSPRSARRISTRSSSRSATDSSSRSARWRASKPAPPSRSRRRCYNGIAGDRSRHREVARVQHDRGGRRHARAHRRARRRRFRTGREIEIVRDAGVRVRNSVRNVEESADRGRAAHRARRLPLPELVALDGHHRTGAAGLGARVVRAAGVLGFTLNTMSLLGLSLAIGILIDDAIVVRENIVRHVEMGVGPHARGARRAPTRSGSPSTATTFSIVAVFVPVGFMPGVAGQWFKPFALTIAAAVLVSLFVSFSLDPMLSAYWPDPQLEAHDRRNPIARALERFNHWFDRQATRYKALIGWALDHRVLMIGHRRRCSFVVAIVLQVAFGGFGFRAGERPQRVEHRRRDAAGLEPRVHDAQGGGGRATIARAIRKSSTPIPPSAAARAPARSTTRRIYVRLVPKHQRSISQDAFGQILRQELREDRRRDGVHLRVGGFGGERRRSCSSSYRVPMQDVSTRSPSRSRNSMAADAGRGRRRPVDARPEAGAQRAGQSRPRRHARREPRAARDVAALRVRRRRRGHVGRSGGHLALRARAARCRRRARTRPTSGSCR